MSLLKKISILLIIIYLTLSGRLSAQIIETDVTDTTISKSSNQTGSFSYSFDINHDGTKDFFIAVKAAIVIPTGCTILPPMQPELSTWIATMPASSNQIACNEQLKDSNYRIDFNEITNGIYIYQLTGEKYFKSGKFLIN